MQVSSTPTLDIILFESQIDRISIQNTESQLYESVKIMVINTTVSTEHDCEGSSKVKCNYHPSIINIISKHIDIQVIDSTLDSTSIVLKSTETVNIYMSNAHFTNNFSIKQILLGVHLDLGSGNAFLNIADSSFSGFSNNIPTAETHGAVTIQRVKGIGLPSQFHFRRTLFSSGGRGVAILLRGPGNIIFDECEFRDNMARGSGAALLISQRQDAPHILADDIDVNDALLVSIIHSIFSNNKAMGSWGISDQLNASLYFQGSGGAVYANYDTHGIFDNTHFTLLLSNNHFENNTAEVAGGTLYLGPLIACGSFHNTFINSQNFDHALFGDILYSTGHTSINNDSIRLATASSRSSVIHFSNPLSDYLLLLKYTLQCPYGYNLETFNSTNPTYARPYAMESLYQYCKGCPPGKLTFSTASIKYEVLFEDDKFDRILNESKRAVCFNCPYGAICKDGRIRARINHWGYLEENIGINMHRCPERYCCPEGRCISYDECSPHRHGPLCGHCDDGYTEALFSADCLEDSKCTDNYWIWIIVIAAVGMLYTLFFLIGDEITTLINRNTYLVKKKLIYPFQRKERDQRNNESDNRTVSSNNNKEHIHYNTTGEDGRNIVESGLFDIFMFFIQSAALFKVSLIYNSDNRNNLEQVGETVENIFNFESLSVFKDVCLFPGVTPVLKRFLHFSFVGFIYVFLLLVYVFYLFFRISCRCWKEGGLCFCNYVRPMNIRLVCALILLLLYTYQITAANSLLLLHCVEVKNETILYIDGTEPCIQWWQYIIIGFVLVYVVPFFLVLLIAPFLLKIQAISIHLFVTSLLLPLPMSPYLFTIYFCKSYPSKKANSTQLPSVLVLEVLELISGHFRSDLTGHICWEGIIILRRLILISMASFIKSAVARLTGLSLATVSILLIHIFILPFKKYSSNLAEALALSLLVMISIINLVKATYLESEAVPHGHMNTLFFIYDWIELVFTGILPAVVFGLIGLAMFFWVLQKIKKLCSKCQSEDFTDYSDISSNADDCTYRRYQTPRTITRYNDHYIQDTGNHSDDHLTQMAQYLPTYKAMYHSKHTMYRSYLDQ